MLRQAHRILASFLVSLAVACAADPPAPDQSKSMTEVVEPGVQVRSWVLNGAGDVETELSRVTDGDVLASAWFLARDQRWDYVVFLPDSAGQSQHRGEVFSEDMAEPASLAVLNQRLVERWRETFAALPTDLDDPGCDVVGDGAFPAQLTFAKEGGIDGDNHCAQTCCAMHDKCFAERGCTAMSMIPVVGGAMLAGSALTNTAAGRNPLGCWGCNVRVYSCLGACGAAPRLAKNMQAKIKSNTCPEGQHSCYDVDCQDGFYCREDCYKEPTPCEEREAQENGKHWCEDACRDLKGREGMLVDNGTTCSESGLITPCDCPVVSFANQYHGHCVDEKCAKGRLGFCANDCGVAGNVLASPCCGALGQTCCSDGGNPCDPNSGCFDGTCQCGAREQPCCGGTSCSSSTLVCNGSHRCVDCGGDNKPCCDGQVCGPGLSCGGSGMCRDDTNVDLVPSTAFFNGSNQLVVRVLNLGTERSDATVDVQVTFRPMCNMTYVRTRQLGPLNAGATGEITLTPYSGADAIPQTHACRPSSTTVVVDVADVVSESHESNNDEEFFH